MLFGWNDLIKNIYIKILLNGAVLILFEGKYQP